MGLTVLPPSQPSRGRAPASRACATRLRLDPACIGSSAASKGPKRPGSCRDEDLPRKRRRTGEGTGAASADAMSLEDKHGENGTRCRGGEGDEIEIDVYALGDDALRVIKDRVGAYLEDRAGRLEVPEQIGIIGYSASRSILPEAAPKSIPSKAAPKIIPSEGVSKIIPSKPAPKSIQLESAPKIIPSKAASKSIPLRRPTSILPRSAPTSILPRPTTKSILRTVSSPPAPPKPSEIRGSVSEHLETSNSQSPPKGTPPTSSPSLPELSKPSGSKKSMKELIASAGEVMKKVVRRREIEQLRAAARREVEQIVRTVEFNDPYIDVQDMFK